MRLVCGLAIIHAYASKQKGRPRRSVGPVFSQAAKNIQELPRAFPAGKKLPEGMGELPSPKPKETPQLYALKYFILNATDSHLTTLLNHTECD